MVGLIFILRVVCARAGREPARDPRGRGTCIIDSIHVQNATWVLLSDRICILLIPRSYYPTHNESATFLMTKILSIPLLTQVVMAFE